MDTVRMKQGIDHTLHPIVMLIREFKNMCASAAGEYIHYGAVPDGGLKYEVQHLSGENVLPWE